MTRCSMVSPHLADYQSAVEVRRIAPAEALDEEADHAVAEFMLLGNIRVAAHEQRIADALIDDAMPLGGVFGRVTTLLVDILTPDGPVNVCRDLPLPSYLGGAHSSTIFTGRVSHSRQAMPMSASRRALTRSRGSGIPTRSLIVSWG